MPKFSTLNPSSITITVRIQPSVDIVLSRIISEFDGILDVGLDGSELIQDAQVVGVIVGEGTL